MTVLVIEDEPGIVEVLRRGLEAAGYLVALEADGREGLVRAQRDDVDLVVLDLGLPGLPGEDLLQRLRAVRPKLPVIVLTAKDAVQDRVANLEAGADDYLLKPFHISELLARVRARLRQPEPASAEVLSAAGIRLDLRTRRVQSAGREVALSSREFALLQVLLTYAGQTLSQGQLLQQAWGYDFDGSSNVVEGYVRHLRRKLGAQRIETVRGVGYRLVDR